MSKLETNIIDTVSGTSNLTIGSTNTSTITVPNGAVSGHNYPAFAVYNSAAQSLTNTTWTKVNLDTKTYDTDNAFDTTNYKFTVPSNKAGKYFFEYRGWQDSGVDRDFWQIALYLNDTKQSYESQTRTFISYPSTTTAMVHGSAVFDLSVDDEICLYCYRAGMGSNTTATALRLSGFRIGA